MQRLLVFRIVSLALAAALVLAGCGGAPPAPSVTSVTVTPATATLNIGGTQQLTATVAVQNGAPTTVTWSSSNSAVASVDATGKVTANAAGTATITATSTADPSKKDTATITVNPPTISGVTISPPSALLSVGNTQQFTATVTGSTGFNNAVNWSSNNNAVASVSNTGLVTAHAAGTATITATSVADPSKSASATVTVVDTLTFQNYSALAATELQPIPAQNASVAGGTPPYTFSEIDPLPAGLSLNSATGEISGTPTAASTTASYTIKVTDSQGSTATATIQITVNPAPTVGTDYVSPVNLAVGQAFTSSTPVVSGGTPPYTFAVSATSPALPDGLNIDSGTGVISGTPSPLAASAPTSYTITATDAYGATVTFNINIAVLAVVTNYTSPAGLTVGRPFTSSTPVVSGGTPPYTFAASLTSPLPAGLSINSSTGVISGTPSTPSPATDYTITATDANGATIDLALNLTVNPAPTVGTNYTSPVIAAQGRPFTSSTPVVSGGTAPFTFTISPALPAGLSINSSTGVISGTPTVTTGATNYTVTATDANGATTSFVINIDVNTPPALSYTVTRNLTRNRSINSGNYTVTTGGGTGTKTYVVFSGSLPPGLSLNPSTGSIGGTPTTAGSYSAVIRVTDTAGYFTDATFAITVNPTPVLSYPSPVNVLTTASGVVVASPTVSGGTGPFTYSQSPVSGPGLGGNFTFSNSTGEFTADTPTAGTYVRNVTVTDSNGATATFQITIIATAP